MPFEHRNIQGVRLFAKRRLFVERRLFADRGYPPNAQTATASQWPFVALN